MFADDTEVFNSIQSSYDTIQSRKDIINLETEELQKSCGCAVTTREEGLQYVRPVWKV
jgi:hypothetical protein